MSGLGDKHKIVRVNIVQILSSLYII